VRCRAEIRNRERIVGREPMKGGRDRGGRPVALRRLRLAGALMVAGLAGAAGAQSAAWTTPTEPVTLTYWDSADSVKNELLARRLIPEYQQLRPNVTIRYEVVPGLSSKVLVAVGTGTAPEIFEVADFLLPKLLEARALEPLPPAAWGHASLAGVLETYLPGRLDGMMDGGRLFAVPDQMNAFSLYANNRLFREAGLDPVQDMPRTWDDVARLNARLTRREGNRVLRKGWEMRYAAEHWLARMFHVLVYQAGGDVLRDGRPAFNSASGLRALEVWKSLTVAPRVTWNTSSSPYEDFAREQDAMTFAGPNAGPSIERINPRMVGNYTVAPLPSIAADRPVSHLYSFNWAVNARASDAQKRAAWDFIRYASTQPAVWMAEARYLQPLRGWHDEPSARQIPFLNVFIHDISVGRALARTAHYAELQAVLARMIERVVLGGADPQGALDQAAEEFARATRG
jgi:multiple sugar transport system substrate-binding protein